MDGLIAPSVAETDWKEKATSAFMLDETDYAEWRGRDAANVARLQIGQNWGHAEEEPFDLNGPLRPEEKFDGIIGRSASLRAVLD